MGNRFTTAPVSDTSWLIYDTLYSRDDSRHVVARIEAAEDFYDVAWVRPLPLPTTYLRLEDALYDVERCTARGSVCDSTRPISIPHMPPVRSTER